MHRLATVLILVLLAACSAPEPPVAAEPVPSPQASTSSAAAAPATPAEAVSPSFDCAQAQGEAEKLVCADPELARLDRQLAERFAKAKDMPDAAGVVALQRGWVKERDECWKADDKARCVREAYLTRLVELAINSGGVVVPTPVEYGCDDNSKPLTMVFYNDLDPVAAVITWGNDQAIVFPQPAASGARYGRDGIDFWEHQGEARIDFHGNSLTCRPAT